MFKKPYSVPLISTILGVLVGTYLIVTLKESLVTHLFMGGFFYGMAFAAAHSLLNQLDKEGEQNA
jgi:hypothetical protein